MSPGSALLLTSVAAVVFVPLALAEKRTVGLRAGYALAGMLFALSLGLLFASLGFERHSAMGSNRLAVERVTPGAVEVDVATRWAAHGFGGWLAVLAAGELLRLVLNTRPVGTELLGPSLLFLGGALLIEPHWGVGVAFAVGLVCVTVVAVWGRPPTPARAPAGAIAPAAPPDARPAEPDR